MKHARRDLCGGCSAMSIPTAIILRGILLRIGIRMAVGRFARHEFKGNCSHSENDRLELEG